MIGIELKLELWYLKAFQIVVEEAIMLPFLKANVKHIFHHPFTKTVIFKTNLCASQRDKLKIHICDFSMLLFGVLLGSHQINHREQRTRARALGFYSLL